MAKCTICQNPKRKEIEKALVSVGATIRGIARQFAVSEDALSRHVKGGHIKSKIEKAAVAQEKADADDFITYLEQRRTRFKEMAREARDKSDPHLELKVYQVESKFGEMEGKARGAFREKVEHTGPGGKPLEIKVIRV
jgi:IS30 family transposase